MIGSIGEDHILVKEVLMPWGNPIPSNSVGRLVEILDDARVVLHFEDRGRVMISRCAIRLRTIPENVEVPMIISELAKHMIEAGTGVNHRAVPEWFQSTVSVLRAMPELSKMGQAQMEFVIKSHMEYRRVDNRADLVANVLFGIQSCAGNPQLRTMERKLHSYKDKLDTEWKKLNKIVPIEFQYAALRAYAEMLND